MKLQSLKKNPYALQLTQQHYTQRAGIFPSCTRIFPSWLNNIVHGIRKDEYNRDANHIIKKDLSFLKFSGVKHQLTIRIKNTSLGGAEVKKMVMLT